MRPLTQRERRLVALGLLVLALGLTWLLLVEPIVSGFAERREERRVLLATYARNQRVLAALPALSAQAAAQRRTAPAFSLIAADPATGRDALRDRLVSVVSAQGGSVQSAAPLEVGPPPGWVGARADATLTLTQLYESLRRLANEEPYAVVEYIAIGAERAALTGVAGPLDVRLEISAPFRPAPPRGA